MEVVPALAALEIAPALQRVPAAPVRVVLVRSGSREIIVLATIGVPVIVPSLAAMTGGIVTARISAIEFISATTI
jgi:hypothetical protein